MKTKLSENFARNKFNTKEELKQFIQMANSNAVNSNAIEAEYCIQNAQIVNIFNREIEQNKDLIFANGKILGIVEANSVKAKHYYDAKNAFLLPGFIDAHVHIESSLLSPERFAALVLQNGTTGIVADPHEIANVLGIEGIKYMMQSLEDLPIDAYFTLPSCVPASPFEESGACLDAQALEELIADERIVALGEMMNYPGVLFADDQVMQKLMLAHKHNKIIDGHSPMLVGRNLDAYIGAGITTDHECVSLEEMHERIARGMYVLIRQGSSARDAELLLQGVNEKNSHRCCFCCDDISAKEILEEGYMQRHLRMAVKMGLDPLIAIQMLTINTANCYGLKNKGALAPGYAADLVFVDNLRDFNILSVFSKGKPIVIDKENIFEIQVSSAHKALKKSMLIAPYSLESFALKASGKCKVIGVRPDSLVTSLLNMEIKSDAEGCFDYAQNPHLCKIAVLDRHKASGNIGLGLLHGYIAENAKFNGAIASSVSHDSHNIVVIGDSDNAMYTAVKAVEEHGGGIALVRNNNGECRVEHVLPLPIAGLMSDDTAENVSKIKAQLDDFPHAKNVEPLILLSFLALSVIPELKLTAKGLFDVLSFNFTSLQADE